MNEELFKIELLKANNKKEKLYYLKKNEKFTGDYAIVRAFSKNKDLLNTWKGVIDKEFNTIINFKPWNKIELLPNNQLLLQEMNNSSMKRRIFTYHIDLNTRKAIYLFGNYKKINEELLIIELFNNSQKDCSSNLKGFALYDVKKGCLTSNIFHEIGKFEVINNKEVALAKRNLINNSNCPYPLEVLCYIDKEGEICSNVYSSFRNKFVEISKDNFEKFIENEESQIKKTPNHSEVLIKLKRKIS